MKFRSYLFSLAAFALGGFFSGASLAASSAQNSAYSALNASGMMHAPVVSGSLQTLDDVSYGPFGQQTLDVFEPIAATSPTAAKKLLPAVVVVHGGGWFRGSKDDSDAADVAASLAASGFVVFNIDYRLARPWSPGTPKQVRDVLAALRWVIQNAEAYSVDSSKIAIVGGSAGGNLAALAAVRANEIRPATVTAMASLSGTLDLYSLLLDARVHPYQARKDGVFRLEWYLGCFLWRCTAAQTMDASPLYNVHQASCPATYIAVSTRETAPVAPAVKYRAKLAAAGCTARLRMLPGDEHGFAYFPRIDTDLSNFLWAAFDSKS